MSVWIGLTWETDEQNWRKDEEHFENWLSETLQNDLILLFSENGSRMVQFYYICVMIIFTMVEENFKNSFLKRPRMAQIYYFCVMIISPCSKKILKIAFVKRPRMARFYYIFVVIIFTMVEENLENWLPQTSQNGSILLFLCHDYFHHGWRKFLKLPLSNVPEWFNSTIFVSWLFSPWLKKI